MGLGNRQVGTQELESEILSSDDMSLWGTMAYPGITQLGNVGDMRYRDQMVG